jgi:hypothetical protein
MTTFTFILFLGHFLHGFCSQIYSPWLGNKVDSGPPGHIGWRTGTTTLRRSHQYPPVSGYELGHWPPGQRARMFKCLMTTFMFILILGHFLHGLCSQIYSPWLGNNNYLLTYDSYVPLYNRFHRGEWITRVSGGEGALDNPGPLNGTSEASAIWAQE